MAEPVLDPDEIDALVDEPKRVRLARWGGG
jgi:hypothetical protein